MSCQHDPVRHWNGSTTCRRCGAEWILDCSGQRWIQNQRLEMIEAGYWREWIDGHEIRYRMTKKGYGWNYSIGGRAERGFHSTLKQIRRGAADAIARGQIDG